MFKRIICIVFTLFLITSCKQDKELFVLRNLPKGEAIPVVIKRAELKNVSDKIPVFYILEKAIPAQTDDLDGDGIWDEIAMSISTQEKGDLALSLKWEDKMPDFLVRTNIRMGVSEKRDYNFIDVLETIRPKGHVKEDPPRLYQMEGPSWENDKVGFRAYFDTRNGKDIFGKRVKKMVLDSVGLLTGDYHVLANWGMDILKVGNSLGAGALAIKYKDSLYRLENTKIEKFKVITEGAVRSIFEMQYKDWQVDDLTLDLTERITIWAGRNGYQSDVTISGTEEPIQLVVGIVNILSDTIYTKAINNFSYVATHDKQSENKDHLGMAIFTETKNLKAITAAPNEGDGITQTYYGALKYTSNTPITFWFVCGWEMTDEKFTDKDYFLNMIHNEIETINYEL